MDYVNPYRKDAGIVSKIKLRYVKTYCVQMFRVKLSLQKGNCCVIIAVYGLGALRLSVEVLLYSLKRPIYYLGGN